MHEHDDGIEGIWDTDTAHDPDDDAWEAACAEAVAILRRALPDAARSAPPPDVAAAAARLRGGIAAGHSPHGALVRSAGLDPDRLPTDASALLVRATAGIVSPRAPLDVAPEDADALTVLTFGDWLGAVIGLVRARPPATADPASLAGAVASCEEVEGLDPDDVPAVQRAFAVVVPAWRACGIVDDADRLTDVGAWVTPRALARAWGDDLDAGIQGSPRAPAG